MLEGMRAFSFGKQAAQQLAACADELDVPRGTVLFESGEQASGLFLVLSGCVKLTLPASGPQPELVVALMRPGQCLDSGALFDQAPHRLSGRTACRCRLAYVQRQCIERLLERFPELSCFIAKELSRVVYDLIRRLRDPPTGTLGKDRLIRFLLEAPPKPQRGGSAVVTLRDPKRAIAAKLQMTPEHFSRVLRELSSSRLISVDGPRVEIHALEALLAFTSSRKHQRTGK
jgi:CRP-like cAMP-binding protein